MAHVRHRSQIVAIDVLLSLSAVFPFLPNKAHYLGDVPRNRQYTVNCSLPFFNYFCFLCNAGR
jgi:hypothetical protein